MKYKFIGTEYNTEERLMEELEQWLNDPKNEYIHDFTGWVKLKDLKQKIKELKEKHNE
jgi:hypothetical protein